MAYYDDDQFGTPLSNAPLTTSKPASSSRKEEYILLNGCPCKVTEVIQSKTGKEGYDEVKLIGFDIFTGRKYEDIYLSTHNINVPHVERTEFTLTDIIEDYLTLMGDAGKMREDIKVPGGLLGQNLRSAHETGKEIRVTVTAAMGIEAATSFRNG